MERILNTVLTFAIPVIIAVLVVIALILLAKKMYRIADVDKALIITGGKSPKIIISGGAFVIPIIRKADFFDLCMLTVKADEDEIKTGTAVSVIVDWTAQIRPDRRDPKKLETAIISFKERGNQGIIDDVKLTLMGAVRDVVASMTPENVLKDKEAFKQLIQESVDDELQKMGLELVSLNIQDITDNNGYFENIAYLDKADKQKAADLKQAETERITRERRASETLAAEKAEAEASQQAEIARMVAEQAKNAKRKETDLLIASNKVETDTALANAEVAKELQATIRKREVEEHQGAVEIKKQEMANLAAQKKREVMITEAEAEADVEKTKADARVRVAERDADAIKHRAEAEAAKVRAEGKAAADVVQAKQEAEAAGKKAQFMAEADGIKAKGLAEAESIKAQKLAEAEGERALAEARAANDNVNFKIESLKIKTDAQIKVATAAAELMANIGQNAEFVNIGGGNISGLNGTGNNLVDTLMSIPAIMKILDTENQALNGKPITEEIAGISDAALKGLSNVKGDAAEDTEE